MRWMQPRPAFKSLIGFPYLFGPADMGPDLAAVSLTVLKAAL
jgi:hypothetical protein